MIIKRKIELYLPRLEPGQEFVFGVSSLERFSRKITQIGFSRKLEYGESILPSPTFGKTSRFNALGRLIKHRNLPKETVYHQRERLLSEWRGRNPPELVSKVVNGAYHRYQRTLIPPPSIEFRITSRSNGESLVVSPIIQFNGHNQAQLQHTINLFLEVFGECQIFHANLSSIINTPIKNVNWTVLPRGQHPWSHLKSQVEELIRYAPAGNQRSIENRLETVNKYKPDCVRIGRAGFRGYIIFEFSHRNLFVLESIYYGNATYILGTQWEELSGLTKAEILNEQRHQARIIHRDGWDSKIRNILSS
jgi:hypothetical protein